DVKTVFKKPTMLSLAFVKIFVAPAVTLLLVYLLPVEGLIARSAVIYAAAPAASLLPMFVLKYMADPEVAPIASANTFVSTMIAVATMPMWVMIMDAVLK
ncbi:MAG: hypothetical protein HUJ65_03055, partial [Oscillospiraceae bacterium]|nr:hypothetical protein [Oscillospiraceae bacterium]